MSACPQCGQENKEGAKFCIKCGAGLEAQVQAEPQAPAAGAVPPPAATHPPVPPPQAAQPTYQQPAQPTYQQPAQFQQQAPPPGAYQQPYAAPPAAPYPAAYAPAPAYTSKTRSGMFWVGALIVLVAGIMVLVSTWMAWGSGPGGYLSLSGWDWFDIGKAGGGASGEVVNAFFIYSDGYPIFTGLCSLIVGGLIALIAVLMLLFRSKGLGGLAILFSIFALGMAITNLTTILRTEGISVGAGMYIFLVFSFLGLIGGGLSMSG
ncbi:MAG: zinc-ribbon domain-containing protein [Actinomycetota bacterium]